MSISLHPKNCCKVPSLHNTMMVLDDGEGTSCVPHPGTVAPYTRTDYNCTGNDGCSGGWDRALVHLPQPFAASTPPTVAMNTCNGIGRKMAVGKKIFDGRNPFVQDYINFPKAATTHYREYDVNVSFSESLSEQYTFHDGDYGTSLDGTMSSSLSNSGSAISSRPLTAGGVENCSGHSSGANAVQSCIATGIYGGGYSDCYCNNTPLGQFEAFLEYGCADTSMDDSIAQIVTDNKTTMQGLCSIDGVIGTLRITVPMLGTYSGPASGFANWLSSFSYQQDFPDCNGDYSLPTNGKGNKLTVSISDFVFTDTEISGSITFVGHDYYRCEYDYGAPAYSTPWTFVSKGTVDYNATFTFSAKLSAPYTFAQAQADAIELLNTFDFTDDKDFPWQSSGDCRVCPMASIWEAGESPGVGYCEAPTDPAAIASHAADLLEYDGSLRGWLLETTAICNKGFFDFAMDIYHYTDNGDGTEKLCYGYGAYPSDIQGVTQATQVVTGALDTSDFYGSPFSRYLGYYNPIVRPPFVDVSCGFVGDGGDAVYAAKYAEKKVPLPSQNFFGPCGAMRNATLQDSNCNPTSTLRWPGAWSICGKAQVASISRDIGSGVVTVTLTDPAGALITGDAVDFLDFGNAVTTGNVTVTVDSPTQFHFTGSLPVGVAIKSHSAPDPAWYNLNPKGDFVWEFASGNAYDGTPDVVTGLQDNLAKTGGIMFVGPPGSPEINNPKWPSATTRIQSGYPAIAPGGHWYSIPVQAMQDRYYTGPQDDSMSDGNGACTPLVPPPQIPFSEALLVTPFGAPYTFSASDSRWPADGNSTLKLPTVADLANFKCSGIWGATWAWSGLPYSIWPGSTPPSGAIASQGVTGSGASNNITGQGAA